MPHALVYIDNNDNNLATLSLIFVLREAYMLKK